MSWFRRWEWNGIYKSQVSRLCEEIDERVKPFLGHPIEGDWPYVWLDATYLKVRRGGRIVSVAVVIAYRRQRRRPSRGAGPRYLCLGSRDVLDDFLRKLTVAGCAGSSSSSQTRMKGSRPPPAKVLGASWQRCRVHFMRKLSPMPARTATRRLRLYRHRFRPGDAGRRPQAMAPRRRSAAHQLPKLAALLDEAEIDVLAFMHFPKEHWAKICSTNPIERLNG